MSFDVFNEKFCTLFKQAVDRYFAAEDVKNVQPKDFDANLIITVPSEAFFKRVAGGLEEEDIESENWFNHFVVQYYPFQARRRRDILIGFYEWLFVTWIITATCVWIIARLVKSKKH
jgi:hypothetical protein